MFDDREDAVERVARHLRRPVQFDPALDARVMHAIATLPARSRGGPMGKVWLAAAAALAAVIVLSWIDFGSRVPVHVEPRSFQFVMVAPHATRVALVGDFNDWDEARTPMRRARVAGAVWTTVVPLVPGRYRYAFLVDGATWLADPAAPADRNDEFGTPSSVVTVGGL